jgi:hypothetical protein
MKNTHPLVIPLLRRFLFLLVISAIAVLLVSEVSFHLMKDETSRAPETIELVIPSGTGALIAAGKSVPSIPDSMIFVVGDVLLVRNEDTIEHELGPLWIPAGTSASMSLDKQQDFAYTCSFQPTKYFGLTVKPAITWVDRLGALWYGTPPTTMLLLVYSLVVKPLQPAKRQNKNSEAA